MIALEKKEVLKNVKEKGLWEGFIAPNKKHPLELYAGFFIGKIVKIVYDKNENSFLVKTPFEKIELNLYINNYKSNWKSDWGNKIKFWG